MKYLGPTPLKVLLRVFWILLAGAIVSVLLYGWITSGSSDWTFGSNGFSAIQNFNQGFARVITGGSMAGEFRRRGFFGNPRFFAGFIGILRSLILIAGITIGVVTVQKVTAIIKRLSRR